MITHSTSKRNARKAAAPQIESTILIEGTEAKIIKCKARAAFTIGNASIQENETFFLVKSERRVNRYYVVYFNNSRNTYVCSDGCGACEHEHLKAVRNFVMDKVVIPAKESSEVIPMSIPETVKEVRARKAKSVKVESASEFDGSRKLTAEEWKVIQKADRARQRAWQKEYRQAAEALRKETA